MNNLGKDVANMKKVLGDNYGATVLPTINIDGADKPLKPFAAFKLVGVTQATKNAEAAATFAYFMASKEVQELRLKERGYAPTVTELVSQTYEDPAISALINQAKETNSVLTPQAENFGNFWTPAGALGKILAEGTSTDLQADLDTAVEGITQ